MQAREEPASPHQILTDYYATPEDKHTYLDVLFTTSAQHYDRILRYGFLGLGGIHRLRALRRAGLQPGMRVLDVACGTAAVMQQAAKITPISQIVGLDPSAGMLKVARSKFPEATFWQAQAEAIPSPDGAFHFLVMGYGLRHVDSLTATFREYLRVLKPGGKVLILEISRPGSTVGYAFAKAYLKHFLPTLALITCQDKGAREMMRYFWDSIDACASRETILGALATAGFETAQHQCELGMFSAFSAIKPLDGAPVSPRA